VILEFEQIVDPRLFRFGHDRVASPIGIAPNKGRPMRTGNTVHNVHSPGRYKRMSFGCPLELQPPELGAQLAINVGMEGVRWPPGLCGL